MSIFKAYDIRGIYPEEINEGIVEKIAKSIAQFLNVKTIVVGNDMRVSSPALIKSLIKGLINQGINVINVGMVSSPMMYFACNHLNADASIMITASHNPKEYNGMKLTREKAIPISGDTGIIDIEKIYLSGKFDSKEKGSVIEKDITRAYKEHVLSFVKISRKLRVVIDTANGMGGLEIPLIMENLPITIIPLYFDIDGTFPNHGSDPLKDENIKMLQEEVLKNKADIGIALDGDADRVFFVTEKAERIPSDFITCLLAKQFLLKNPGSTILYDLRSSWIVKETIEQMHGKSSMSKVGHAFIKEQLRREDGVFAGELSGHFYFRENFYTDSGIIAALQVLELLSSSDKKMSEIVQPLQKYYASGEINSKVNDKIEIMKKLEETFHLGNISHLDGIHISFDDWWFNVRPSNTEPLLRLNLEAKSKELMESKKLEILGIIREGVL